MSELGQRFARHALLPGWRQSALSDATVVIVGVGALGNVVAQNLALSGVGRLILCDPDSVAPSNLSRTPLFRPADAGRAKVEAAADTLRAMAPGVEVEARRAELASGIGLAELRDAALVLGCLDSQAARLRLAGRCGLVRARSIDAATSPWGGEVRCYLDLDAGCFGCGLTAAERSVVDQPWSCLDTRAEPEVGASIAVSAWVASLMSLLAVRTLMGLPVASQTLVLDGERGAMNPVRHARDPECPLHEPLVIQRTIRLGQDPTVGELQHALGDQGSAELWQPVSVRAECPSCGWSKSGGAELGPAPCPVCGARTRVRTSQSVASLPADARLRAIGVAPREILPVKTPSGMVCVELR